MASLHYSMPTASIVQRVVSTCAWAEIHAHPPDYGSPKLEVSIFGLCKV
jgi:hypothetical protein